MTSPQAPAVQKGPARRPASPRCKGREPRWARLAGSRRRGEDYSSRRSARLTDTRRRFLRPHLVRLGASPWPSSPKIRPSSWSVFLPGSYPRLPGALAVRPGAPRPLSRPIPAVCVKACGHRHAPSAKHSAWRSPRRPCHRSLASHCRVLFLKYLWKEKKEKKSSLDRSFWIHSVPAPLV